MKRYFAFALIAVLVPLPALAQQGTVQYDLTVALDFKMPDEVKNMKIEGLEEAFANMPEEITTRHVLFFDAASSLMQHDESYQDGKEAATASSTVMVRGGRASFEADKVEMKMRASFGMGSSPQGTTGATFVDFESGIYTQQREFMGRTFLVSGDRKAPAWKLPGEERTLLGLHIVKATAVVDDSVDVEAWFAPEIPVPGGPALYGGLPGLIMVLSIDGGRKVFTAVELDLENLPEFEKPTKGRKMTQAEYDQVVADKQEELKKTRKGGSGDRVVIIRQ